MKRKILPITLLFIASYVNASININDMTHKIKTMANGFNNVYKAHMLNQTSGVFATVGADGSCDFNSIQTAINSHVAEIRVATNKVYTEQLQLNSNDIIIRILFAAKRSFVLIQTEK